MEKYRSKRYNKQQESSNEENLNGKQRLRICNNSIKRNVYHLHPEKGVQLYEIIQDVDKRVLIFEYADMDLKMCIDKEKCIKDIK